MYQRLCACLLNISEARNSNIVHRIASAALKPIRGQEKAYGEQRQTTATVLNVFSDHDYNRSVITIAAEAEHIASSVISACQEAFQLIDIGKHVGGHPRLGSVDLVPIHPLAADLSLEDCGIIARDIAHKLAESVPGTSFFLFGSADVPHTRGLVQRRKEIKWYSGGSEDTVSVRQQDVGASPGTRYGLTGIGAIPYVMNCNVTIQCQDVQFGKAIAADVRATAPNGLPGVQSMAFEHEGNVEIPCNVEAFYLNDKDYAAHPLKDKLTCSFGKCYYVPANVLKERIAALASMKSVKTEEAALVGFSPDEARKVAILALSTGQGEYWKTRKTRMM